MTKQWKENPPGTEQLALQDMFEKGEIEDFETPADVQSRIPMFQAFSEKVFMGKFRKTKARLGVYARNPVSRVVNREIPELGLVAQSSQSRSKASKSLVDIKNESGIQFENAPYVTWVYTDHNKNCDFVCVAVCMMSGSRDIKFMLSEDGKTLHISYIWPSALYSARELFEEKLNGRDKIAIDHPKIHTFTSRLLERELTEKSLPQGSIVIDLPTKVLREVGSWTKPAIKANDTRIALLEFQAFQKKQIIEDADTSINFD